MALNNLHSVASLFTHTQTHTHTHKHFFLCPDCSEWTTLQSPHRLTSPGSGYKTICFSLCVCVCVCVCVRTAISAILPGCISNEMATLTTVFYIFLHPPQVFSCHQSKCTIEAISSKNYSGHTLQTQVTAIVTVAFTTGVVNIGPPYDFPWGSPHKPLSLRVRCLFCVFKVALCQVFM